MSFEALTNHREYLSAFYLAEVLPATMKKDVLPRWLAAEKAGQTTPRQGIRALRQTYFAFKSELVELDTETDLEIAKAQDKLHELHGEILQALGFPSGLIGQSATVPGVVVVEGAWAVDTDASSNPDDAGRLLEAYAVDNRRTIDTCFALASYLFTTDEPPRYVLILNGGVLTLADRHTWGEGRYLAVSLDVAFGRNDARPAGELDAIAALFGADSLLPPPEGGDAQLAKLVAESRQKAVGVSGELREGLRRSVELIANEVLDRIREQGVDPTQLMEPRDLAKSLGRESLRYLYRILFLLYAEARPDLGVLPSDDREYVEGYSMARLGDLVSRKLGGEQARRSFHLYESLDLLFRMVNEGHEGRGTNVVEADASEGVGIRFEALKSDLFLPEYTQHIGRAAFRHPDDDDEPSPRMIDTRLRNGTLYQVLRLLMLTKGKRKERGGFISYAQLGINQLGAVYEGLMSYSGFIAAEELYEVAKNGDSKDGSWMIPASKVDEYDDEVFVTRVDDETGIRSRERYPAGSFVYRLAGRDRQTSASYYTPQSLTEVTVQLALKYRLDQDGTVTKARELLDWTICEPALGSGAFLNEAINQVAAEYLRRRQSELDTRIDPDQYATELQKVKAYIALHNSYGVDLNRTAVELAEVSLVAQRDAQGPRSAMVRSAPAPGQLIDRRAAAVLHTLPNWLTSRGSPRHRPTIRCGQPSRSRLSASTTFYCQPRVGVRWLARRKPGRWLPRTPSASVTGGAASSRCRPPRARTARSSGCRQSPAGWNFFGTWSGNGWPCPNRRSGAASRSGVPMTCPL